MKLIIFSLLFVSLHQYTFCTLSTVGKNISFGFNYVYDFFKRNIVLNVAKVKKLFTAGDGKLVGGSQKIVKLNEPQSEGRRAFDEFVEKDQDVNSVLDPRFVNLKSESVVTLATPQLARWHGRDMESHVVATRDGFHLTLHRISSSPLSVANRTVLLHHGLLGSSTDWILLGPEKSLPYILSDVGYDVWIANARGNYYSRGHRSMTVDFIEYWNFSWQEMGQYDLPAVIDYIRLTKNTNESINYIGHSMGATALLVLLSTAPQYNDYLRIGILLAPLIYMGNIEGPLNALTSVSDEIMKTMGDGEFLPSRKVPSWLADKYCKGPKNYCYNPLLFLSGIPQGKKRSASFIARLLYHVPAGGSIKTIMHYIQLAKSGKFHKYNDESSEFCISNITLPIALFSSSEDWLATVGDVLKLYFSLINPIDHYIIRGRNVSHTDFVWGYEANILVFYKIIQYLENGLDWNSLKSNEVE